MDINNFKYKVYPISQLNILDWSLFTHSTETCRKSVDGSEFIVRYKGIPPEGETTLTHAEAKILMATPDWEISED